MHQAALRHSVPDFTPVFEPVVAPTLVGDLLELSRPCLRHVELEVEIVTVGEPDPELDDPWFAGGDAELAADTISLGDADPYLPEPRRRLPVAIGVAVAALAVVVFIAT